MPTNEAKRPGNQPIIWVILALAVVVGLVIGLTGWSPSNMRTTMYWAAIAGAVLMLVSIYIGKRREK